MPVKAESRMEISIEGKFTAHSLDDIAGMLGKTQVMKIYLKPFADIEDKIRTYPLLNVPKGRISNGTHVYLVTPGGCFMVWIGKG